MQQDIDRKSAEAEHTLAFLDQQLPQLRSELDQAEQRYNNFRNKQGTVDLSEESRLLLQQIVENKTKLVDLQQQRAELAHAFHCGPPGGCRARCADRRSCQSVQGRLTHNVSTLPDTEQTALRLLRDVRVDTELYTNLLNSAQQLRIVKAGQVGSVRVVDYAEPADEPVRPQRVLLISALRGGLGLVLGILRGVHAQDLVWRRAEYDRNRSPARRAGLCGRAAQQPAAARAAQCRLAPRGRACAGGAGAGRRRRRRRAQSAHHAAVRTSVGA